MPTLIYLHGFLSSSLSTKAQQAQQWFARHQPDWRYFCPELSAHPADAEQTLKKVITPLMAKGESVYVMGSSLGGFWATWVVENFGGKAVLINPAVAPHTRFGHFVGQRLKSFYGDTHYTLTVQDLAHLQALDFPHLKDASRYKVLLQKGDETLDYRMAEQKYACSHLLIEEGGDHSFIGFVDHLPAILQFFKAP